MEENIKKSIIFDKELHDKVTKLASENDRDFTKQVKFMLREYIRINEKK